MAKPTSTSGSAKRRQKRKHVARGKPLGTGWQALVATVVKKDAAKRANAQTDSKDARSGVGARIPVTFFVDFPRTGKGIAANRATCSCVITEDVCICYGSCEDVFPDCCDEGPILTKG